MLSCTNSTLRQDTSLCTFHAYILLLYICLVVKLSCSYIFVTLILFSLIFYIYCDINTFHYIFCCNHDTNTGPHPAASAVTLTSVHIIKANRPKAVISSPQEGKRTPESAASSLLRLQKGGHRLRRKTSF